MKDERAGQERTDEEIPTPELTANAADRAVGANLAFADFTRREFGLREWMDEPCTYADYRAAARDMAQANRWTRGYRPTLEFLGHVLDRTGVGYEPLHVVDIGCGHGDALRAIYRWAAKRSVALRLTGIDLNPYAARMARECDRREHLPAKTIEWVTGSLFDAALARPADVVISSLLAHHLDDGDVVRLLQWCDSKARVGWLVNDLERAEQPARMFAWMAKGLRRHRMIAHDGPVSFRRAFSMQDWSGYLREAGIEGARVFASRPARLCVEKQKDRSVDQWDVRQ